MKCPNCGNENPPDYVFCDECGARLQGGDAMEAPAQQSFEADNSAALQGQAGGTAGSAAGAPQPVYSSYSGGNGQAESGGNSLGDAASQGAGYAPYMGTGSDTGADSSAAQQYSGANEAPGSALSYSAYSPATESGSIGAGAGGGVGMAGAGDTGGTGGPGGAATGYGSGEQGQNAGAYSGNQDYGQVGQADQADSVSAGDNSQVAAQEPVTEDTMQVYSDAGQGDNSGADAQSGGYSSLDSSQASQAPAPLPGVSEIDDSDNAPAPADSSGASSTVIYTPMDDEGAADTSMESVGTGTGTGTSMSTQESNGNGAAGQSDMGTAQSGGEWAGQAIQHLDNAQQALGSGDWEAFGRHMSQLRSYLGGSVGAAGMSSSATPQLVSSGAGTSTGSQEQASDYASANSTTSAAPAASSTTAQDQGAGAGYSTAQSQDTSQAQSSPGATLEPEAEAGNLEAGAATQAPAYPDYSSSYGGYSPADQGASNMQGAGATQQEAGSDMGASAAPVAGAGMAGSTDGASNDMLARLVIISTGAELPLPDQEEITVGREDPSSGIFPDVDLTPYGGEEGGVSRRHARLLKTNNEFFVEDLQSTNFTKLDGQRLPAHARERLEDGARIDFGRVATIFRRS